MSDLRGHIVKDSNDWYMCMAITPSGYGWAGYQYRAVRFSSREQAIAAAEWANASALRPPVSATWKARAVKLVARRKR